MLFNIPFVADWHKIGEQRQSLTNRGTQHENPKHIDYNYKFGGKILVIKESIFHKAEVQLLQRAIDYHNSSYEWNYQDSTQNQNRTTKYPESTTIYR
jgi:hypothetical protein